MILIRNISFISNTRNFILISIKITYYKMI